VPDLLILFGVHSSIGVNRASILDLTLCRGRFLSLIRGSISIGLRLRIDVFDDFFNQIVHSEYFDLPSGILL
jgi:hypothetical protein